MLKNVNVCLFAVVCLSQNLFACEEAETKTYPFLDALTTTRNANQYRDFASKLKDICAICGTSEPELNHQWYHPFGNWVHEHCLRDIKSSENATINNSIFLGRGGSHWDLPYFHDEDCVHRLIVWFVMKLCSPYPIAEYKKIFGKEELTRFFNSANSFANARYAKYLSYLHHLDDPSKAEKMCGNKAKIMSFLLFGEPVLKKDRSSQAV